MSLFAPRVEQRSEDWTGWEAGGGAPGSSATPTGLVPFFAALRHIVDYLSTLPVDGNRVDGDGRSPMSSLPPLLRRLDDAGDIGMHNWIGQWAYGLAAHGNAVGWVTAVDGFGFPLSIRWLRRIDWSYDESMGIWYIYGVPIKSTARIIHSPWIVPIGCTLGISPTDRFHDFWKAGRAAQDYADVSRGGGTPPAILKNNALELDDPAAARAIQLAARKAFASGDPFVAGKAWDLTMLTVPPNQAKFLETLALTANQTAAIFGIDPREIGGTGADGTITYANDESRALNRASNMRPYLERFEDMIARITPEKQYIKLNVDATLRTDTLTRTQVIGAQIADGRLSVNEARELEDRPPVTGGDFHNVPTQYTPPAPLAPAPTE